MVPDAQEVLMTRASSDSLPDMMNHWPTDAQFVQFEDGAYPPTGFEDTKRGKIQNVLLDKDVDAFLKEMTNDWNQAVEDSK